jgi:hypothetical protein
MCKDTTNPKAQVRAPAPEQEPQGLMADLARVGLEATKRSLVKGEGRQRLYRPYCKSEVRAACRIPVRVFSDTIYPPVSFAQGWTDSFDSSRNISAMPWRHAMLV